MNWNWGQMFTIAGGIIIAVLAVGLLGSVAGRRA